METLSRRHRSKAFLARMTSVLFLMTTFSAAGKAEERSDGCGSNHSDPARIVERMLEVNSVWLNPQIERLKYRLIGCDPQADSPKSEYVSRVWIDGKNCRWEMDSTRHFPPDEPRELGYTLVIRDTEEMYLRAPHQKMLKNRNPARDVSKLRQGLTWSTAMHAVQHDGLPDGTTIVERRPTEEGEIIVLQMDLPNQRLNVGLGLYHLHFGQTGRPLGKVRLHLKLPQCVPVMEELVDQNVRVEYSSSQLLFDKQFAPETIRYIAEDTLRDGRTWELQARFMKLENLWLLDSAVNKQGGTTVKRLYLADVSTAKIDPQLFQFEGK
jgi:hypothetical protein